MEIPPLSDGAEVLSVEPKPAELDLSEADVIVACGRGVKNEAGLAMVRELAALLGAQTACTRPLAEAGWFDPKRQIGLSGRTVKPKLIVTVGISGSVQFAAGMKGADRIIAEVNNGGDLVEATIRSVDASVPYKAVHAARGKHTRAEPVAALYERGMVHHVGDAGSFEALEDQMCNWLPDPGFPSPDRMDALVWALTELMLTPVAQSYRVVVVPEDDRDISPI